MLYDYFLPAYKAGGPIQSLQNLANFFKSEVRVICSNKDIDGSTLNATTNEWCETSGIKVFYSTGFLKYYPIIRDSPILFINGIYSLTYNLLPILFCKGRKIISVRGMLSVEALNQKKVKKIAYLSLLKLVKMSRKCEFHATTLAEQKDIYRVFGPKSKVWIMPNLPKKINPQSIKTKRQNSLILTTVALISPMKNYHTVLEALKICKGSIVYNIYGPVKDKGYWQKCEELIKLLPGNIVVNYYGELEPEKVSEVIAGSHVYIQPSLSENFGHSLYEALSMGRPLITSHETPWQNLRECHAGINAASDNVAEIAESISFFTDMDEEELATWSNGAAAYALKAMDVPYVKSQYAKMFGIAGSQNDSEANDDRISG